jgi:hypothetical protein
VSNLFARSAPHVREIRQVSVNGADGLFVDHDEGPLVLTADVDDDGRIDRLWIQMNPDKFTRSSATTATTLASSDDRPG